MFAQTDVGRFVKGFRKPTGEIILQFERMRFNIPESEWEIIQDSIYGPLQTHVPTQNAK